MLAMVLRMFGVDLQEEVARLKAQANEVAERASDRVHRRSGGRIHGWHCASRPVFIGGSAARAAGCVGGGRWRDFGASSSDVHSRGCEK
jgi:hypothetical protein